MVRIIVIVGFLTAFGAGLVMGLYVRQSGSANATGAPHNTVPGSTTQETRPSSRPSPWSVMATELSLTPEQQEQVKKIWADTARRGGRESEDKWRQIRKDRDEAIAALIRPEDKPRYDDVMKNYQERQAGLEKESRDKFQSAVEKTKAILSPEQRLKYEDFLKRHTPPHRDGSRRPGDGAATRPADAPATTPSASQ